MGTFLEALLVVMLCAHVAHGLDRGTSADQPVCPQGYTAEADSCGYVMTYVGKTYNGCQGSGWTKPEPKERFSYKHAGPCEDFCSDCSGGIATMHRLEGRHSLNYHYCCNKDATGVQLPLQFEPVVVGSDRACRSYTGSNHPSFYTVRTGVASIWECEAQCVNYVQPEYVYEPGKASPILHCNAIEYSDAFDNGRCELWEVIDSPYGGSGPLEPIEMPGFTCLMYNSHGVPFQPVDGGHNRACRAQGGKNGPSYYELRLGVTTIFACESLCVGISSCVGIEYNKDGRCELWKVDYQSPEINVTAPLGINTTVPNTGYTCLQIAGYVLDARMAAKAP